MAPRKIEIVKESYYTLILCCFFIYEIKKKLVTNNKKLLNSYIWHSGCPNYQITAFVFLFQVCWVGVWGWLYLINSLQIKQLYNSFIISKILVYIFNIFLFDKPLKLNGKKRLSHKMCYTPDIFNNIFRWEFFLKRYISVIFCGHNHIIITLYY